MKYLKQSFALFMFLFLVGCLNNDKDDPKQLALDQNLSIWNDADISDYQYTSKISCFCGGPREDKVIVVRENVVSEAFLTPSGVYLAESDLDDLHTISDLFAIVQEAIDSNVDSLEVTYNADFGYPELIDIDRSEEVSDDEVTYYAKDFQ